MIEVLAGLGVIAAVLLGYALAGGFRRTPPIYVPPIANTSPPAEVVILDEELRREAA